MASPGRTSTALTNRSLGVPTTALDGDIRGTIGTDHAIDDVWHRGRCAPVRRAVPWLDGRRTRGPTAGHFTPTRASWLNQIEIWFSTWPTSGSPVPPPACLTRSGGPERPEGLRHLACLRLQVAMLLDFTATSAADRPSG